MLANLFLHQVLDEWFVKDVQPRVKGRSFLIRFADDFIIGCEQEADARRVMGVLPKRFPLLGQDAPWILGHQAQDDQETSASVYERDMDMV